MAIRLRLLSSCQRSLRFVFRVVSWIPVLFVCAILAWGYYVYVYVMNISGTFRKGSSEVNTFITVILLVCAHIILGLQVVSFFRTIFARHKPVPAQFHLMEDQLDELDQAVNEHSVLRELATNLPVNELSRSGGVRYCDRCEMIKPDRCHHCSLCNRCILKMDHHCPWVNNCVGYSNYKFFVLFLFYTVLLSLWFCTTGLFDFIQAWKGFSTNNSTKFNVIFCYFVSSLFGLSTSVLLAFHIYLSFFNRTTLENMQSPRVSGGCDRRLYFMGFKRNLQQVFGSNCLMALVPIATSEGDGMNYPTKRRHVELGLLRNSLQDPQKSEEDSEVEIFDSSEQRLLAATSHL